MSRIKKWPKGEVVGEQSYGIFSVETVRKTSPRTAKESDFVHISTSDWISIVAITSDRKVIMVEQYRHGSDSVQIDLPGGAIDQDETPEHAALRELQEETGYSGHEAIHIGQFNPNPALFKNNYYIFFIPNAIPVSTQSLDDAEDIKIKIIPLDSIATLIKSGAVEHALVVTAFYMLEHHDDSHLTII